MGNVVIREEFPFKCFPKLLTLCLGDSCKYRNPIQSVTAILIILITDWISQLCPSEDHFNGSPSKSHQIYSEAVTGNSRCNMFQKGLEDIVMMKRKKANISKGQVAPEFQSSSSVPSILGFLLNFCHLLRLYLRLNLTHQCTV